jgi:hypothetical protein
VERTALGHFRDRKATLIGFFERRHHVPQLSLISLHNRAHTTRYKSGRKGVVMRGSFGSGIPETAPYTEWLAFVASIGVAALVWAVFFSPGAS